MQVLQNTYRGQGINVGLETAPVPSVNADARARYLIAALYIA